MKICHYKCDACGVMVDDVGHLAFADRHWDLCLFCHYQIKQIIFEKLEELKNAMPHDAKAALRI